MPKTGLSQEELRERAVEYTVARMRKFGYEKVRLSDIAKDLGITHAALYAHFADKAALLDAVSEQWINELDRKLDHVCKDKNISHSLDRITKWFMVLHRAKRKKVENDPEIFRAFNHSSQLEKPFVRDHIALMNSQMTNLVQRAIDDGLLKGKAETIKDILLASTIEFHHPLMLVDRIGQNRESLLEQILLTVYAGCRRKI